MCTSLSLQCVFIVLVCSHSELIKIKLKKYIVCYFWDLINLMPVMDFCQKSLPPPSSLEGMLVVE